MYTAPPPTDLFGHEKTHPIHNNNQMQFELDYLNSVKNLKTYGTPSGDRTGTGTKRALVPPYFVVPPNFVPLLRGKFVSPKNSLTEMIWILLGKSDHKWLKDNGVNYWDSWVKEDGTFGPIYGAQMRNFADSNGENGIDQYLNAINKLRTDPNNRKIICNLWNPLQQHLMALEPCHCFYQFLVIDNVLQLRVYQRSADCFLGVPYDFMLFYHMLNISAYLVGIETGFTTISFGDYHLYNNHANQIDTYESNIMTNGEQINQHEEIYIHYKYPARPEELTKETLEEWLIEFYKMNDKIDTNYKIGKTTYKGIQADVAV